MRAIPIRTVGIVFVLSLAAGCLSSKSGKSVSGPASPGWVSPGPNDILRTAGALRLTVTSEKAQYQSWESIDLLVAVRNAGNETVILFTGALDLHVEGKGAESVGSPIADRVPALPSGMCSLQPGGSKTVSMLRLATPHRSWRLATGKYKVSARYEFASPEGLPVTRPPGKVWVGRVAAEPLCLDVIGPSPTYRALCSIVQGMSLADSFDERFGQMAGRLPRDQAEGELLAMVRDRNSGNKLEAVWLLGRIGSKRGVPALTAIANGNDPSLFLSAASRRQLGDARLRAFAREALNRIKNPAKPRPPLHSR